MLIPNFLSYERILNFKNNLIKEPMYLLHFILFNSPVLYQIYKNKFEMKIFIFSYLIGGIFQGFINTFLYYLSDKYFFGKEIDIKKWSSTSFYNLVIYNTDSLYLYVLGSMVYISLSILPESIKWTLKYPGLENCIYQFLYLFLLHDILFTIIHYTVHKITYLRTSHIKLHHECPFEIGSSRCAIATEGVEGLIRDLYSATIPTYIIGILGIGNFYAYTWILYYSLYSFWAMYIHTGVNNYHKIHHLNNSSSNYGLYYITDYLIGTLKLK